MKPNKVVNNILGGMPKKDMKSKNMSYDDMLDEAAERKGLNGGEKSKFKTFMKQRFPNENNYYYIGEWAGRFKRGPEKYMDQYSSNVYNKL